MHEVSVTFAITLIMTNGSLAAIRQSPHFQPAVSVEERNLLDHSTQQISNVGKRFLFSVVHVSTNVQRNFNDDDTRVEINKTNSIIE